ncbi:MAG: hypothetical protein WA862_07715 [Solirubrobacterales bacterium]
MSGGEPLVGGSARPAHRLVIDAFRLYRRYPLLFLILAAAVIVPYEVLVLLATGVGPFEQGSLDFAVSSTLTLADLALVTPLVSALHVHAVREVGEGREPKLASIARQGLRALPAVAAVSIISWLGITAGFIALIAPGIYLLLRWAVVAQAAAIDGDGWLPALRRSGHLTEGHYGHVFRFVVYVALIAAVPSLLVGLGFGDDSNDVVSFLVAVPLYIVTYSFAALASGLLYFDLRARREAVAAPESSPPGPIASASAGQARPPADQSLDPTEYAAEERPKGWYVDPGDPNRMRYWEDGDPHGWSTATTRTPRKVRKAWEAKEQGR